MVQYLILTPENETLNQFFFTELTIGDGPSAQHR